MVRELQAAAREALSLMDKQINELYPAIQNVLIFLSFVFVVSISPIELETKVRSLHNHGEGPFSIV